ncbi:MAG TPA: serine/threonine-protein kinase [Longimicrobiales bacterium]|nr:serine/threonine-protein kinase [Longimicrobiales bacterium]
MPDPSPPSPLAAALADRYRLVRPLGEGGMATVYLAHDLRHDREVAIKVLKPELAAVVGGDRFLAEIRTTANLQHPHILPLFDSGEVEGFLYFVMPHVRGETLRARMERERELPVEEAVAIAEKVAGALDYAHREGVIHRDIKPENLLIQDGEPLVADFGIARALQHAGGARLTETGLSLGTPEYMAPEQASGDREPDARSDVYGLGCVVYEMLAGRPPHAGSSVQQVLARVLTEDPPRLTGERKQVPTNVAAAVGTALQRVPADRFSSAREFADALRDPGFRGLAREWEEARGRRLGVAVTGLVAAVAIAVGFLGGRLASNRTGAEPLPTFRQFTNTGTVGCAAISPDGTQVAMIQGSYTAETECGGALVVRALPAGAPLVLMDSVSFGMDLGWSPDGTALLLRGDPEGREPGLYVVPVGGGAPRRIDVGRGFATFKTADSVVVFWGEVMEVRDPRSGTVLSSDSLARSVITADWSEEAGAWLASYYAPGRAYGVAGVLALLDEDFQPTDSLPGFPLDVIWAGSDRALFLEAGPHELSMQSVREIDVRDGRFVGVPRVLRDEILSLGGSASVDGRRWVIVFPQTVDEVVAVDLTGDVGSPVRGVSRSVGSYVTSPSIAPDGRRLAFFRNDLLGPNPYVVDLETGTETPLGSREGRLRDRMLWTLDGERLILGGHAEETLAVFDLAAGTEREIAGTGGCQLGSVAGGGLVFVEGSCWAWGGRDRLRILDLETGEIRNLPAHPGALRSVLVRPDRVWATVLPTPGGESRLTSLDLDGGEWRDHGVFPGARTQHQLLEVDRMGYLYWMESAAATRILRIRPGFDEPELLRELDFQCGLEYADVTADLSSLVCNSSTENPDVWIVERGSEDSG